MALLVFWISDDISAGDFGVGPQATNRIVAKTATFFTINAPIIVNTLAEAILIWLGNLFSTILSAEKIGC